MPKNAQTTAQLLISQASKVMLKILQARLQQYMDCELLDVQAAFRKGRGTRDQIANIHWIIGKAREFQKNIYYAKVFDRVDHNKLENSSRDGNTRPPDLPVEKSVSANDVTENQNEMERTVLPLVDDAAALDGLGST